MLKMWKGARLRSISLDSDLRNSFGRALRPHPGAMTTNCGRRHHAFLPVSYTHLDVYKRQAESRTYRGRNTAAQIQQDAADFCKATCADTNLMRESLLKRGYDPKLVEEAIKKAREAAKNKGGG